MSEKTNRKFRLGESDIDLDKVVRDGRGIEDMIIEAVQNDWSENRFHQFDPELKPFVRWPDLSEWDEMLLKRHPPLYSTKSNGHGEKTGLAKSHDPTRLKARMNLRETLEGANGQISSSRDLLEYAIKVFGADHAASLGTHLTFADAHPVLAGLTGLYVKTLADLDRVISYVETNMVEMQGIASGDTESTIDLEKMSLHTGALLMTAMEVSEIVKISCFGFYTAGEMAMNDLVDFPPADIEGGLGAIEKERPTILFAGDDFLPVWTTVRYLEENKKEGSIQICGVGPAGDDGTRFYKGMKILNSMVKLDKVVRTGLADVLVLSDSCHNVNILETASKVETKVIAVSRRCTLGLDNMTDKPVQEIVDFLLSGSTGVTVLDVEKAGEVAARLAPALERKADYGPDGKELRDEAGKCDGCDLCFNVCPTNLLLGPALDELGKGNEKALEDLFDDCIFCGDCEDACPRHIPIRDLFNAVGKEKREADRFVFRPGRGPVPETEVRAQAFSLTFGNVPGVVAVLSCGDQGTETEVGYIARELASRNCICFTAGCGASSIARAYSPEEKKFIFQEYKAAALARSLVNCGGCTAITHIADEFLKVPRLGGGVSHYANFEEMGDYTYNRLPYFVIMWGVKPKRTLAVASGFARIGVPVIVGPTYGFEFPRYLMGNARDLEGWWMYDGVDGHRRDVEPAPEHLILPCETPDEALTTAIKLLVRPLDLRDSRLTHIETYLDMYERVNGESPDDWPTFVRSEHELPIMQRMKLLKVLRDDYGWEIEGTRIIKAKNRAGELLPMEDYIASYGIEQGHYATRLERLTLDIAKKGKKS